MADQKALHPHAPLRPAARCGEDHRAFSQLRLSSVVGLEVTSSRSPRGF